MQLRVLLLDNGTSTELPSMFTFCDEMAAALRVPAAQIEVKHVVKDEGKLAITFELKSKQQEASGVLGAVASLAGLSSRSSGASIIDQDWDYEADQQRMALHRRVEALAAAIVQKDGGVGGDAPAGALSTPNKAAAGGGVGSGVLNIATAFHAAASHSGSTRSLASSYAPPQGTGRPCLTSARRRHLAS